MPDKPAHMLADHPIEHVVKQKPAGWRLAGFVISGTIGKTGITGITGMTGSRLGQFVQQSMRQARNSANTVQ